MKIDIYYHLHGKKDEILFEEVKEELRPVVRGRWYWDNYKYDWTCYACGWSVDYHNPENPWKEPEYAYCPNCGALNKEDEG